MRIFFGDGEKMTDYTIMTYITNNYVTLLLLAALVILLIAIRKMKISGLQYVWTIMGIVFTLTLCEAFEDICDLYNWDYRLLYIKTALVYWLYPLTAMLELYLVTPIKRKLLIAIPYIINFVLVFIDLFDTHIIYCFNGNHHYFGGLMPDFPIIVLCFYVIMLGVYSVIFIGNHSVSKGFIVGFMALSAIITALGEKEGFAEGYTETVAVIEILIYYFFLAAISYSETQKKLYESRLELEQDRIKLLTAQIQPHFIFNSLSTVQSLCYTDSEAAADIISVFGDYLRGNIDSLASEKPILFSTELEHIRQFIAIQKAGTDVEFEVNFELGVTGFKVPPLTVQPIVENAIKHGALTRRDGTGRVTVKTEEKDNTVIITVNDNGIGAHFTDRQREHYSVGIENARKRLEIQCGGALEICFTEGGCTAVITLPKEAENTEVNI